MTERCYDWFEPLYAKANGDAAQVPWALPGAAPPLTHWLTQNKVQGCGRAAVVVGCGLGDDAEALAEAGFEVTAFDVSRSAIAWAQKRFPNSSVRYVVADVFELPDDWLGRFELVFEFRTIQSLPIAVRAEAIAQIAGLAKPGGTVFVITYMRASEAIPDGPPWPLSEKELAQFEAWELVEESKKISQKKGSRFRDRVQIRFKRNCP